MSNTCTAIFMGVAFFSFRDKISFQIWLNFHFGPWTVVHASEKFELNRIILM